MERIIMHIDVNNAFLSWTAAELLKNGYEIDIRKIPSIIGGDETRRRGIVLAKSPVAKKYGIKTAETIYEAKRKCPSIKMFPPNYNLYQKRSRELFDLLKSYTPDIEIASIDECYLDYTKVKNIYGDEKEFAYKLKEEIKEKFGFTVNIGIANNKLCAKMASDFEKPDKIHTLYQYEIKNKMFPLPVEELFTVGKKTSEKLRMLGVKTIGDLAKENPVKMKKFFKNNGLRLIEIANGIENSKVIAEEQSPKGISNEITTNNDLKTKQEIREILKQLSEKVSMRIRKEKKYAQIVCIILKNNKFKRYSHQKKLKNPINTFIDIYKHSNELLDEIYHNEPIRLVGIRLDDLKEEKNYQTSLFDDNEKKDEKIDNLIDEINNKFGKSIITRASFIEKK